MNNNEDALAICPYYNKFRGKEIQCESRIHKARHVFVFQSEEEARRHKQTYCDEYCWRLCPYADVLTSVWLMDFKRYDKGAIKE